MSNEADEAAVPGALVTEAGQPVGLLFRHPATGNLCRLDVGPETVTDDDGVGVWAIVVEDERAVIDPPLDLDPGYIDTFALVHPDEIVEGVDVDEVLPGGDGFAEYVPAPDPLAGIDEMNLVELNQRLGEVGLDLDGQGWHDVLGNEPASVVATYLRDALRAHVAGEELPAPANYLDEAETLDRTQPVDTAALAAAEQARREAEATEPPADGMQEFRGVNVGETVRVRRDLRDGDEPSVYAGHAGRVIEIIEEATKADDGCPFLLDFGDEREPRSFHFDELVR